MGREGLLCPALPSPPHDHAQPQASIPKRYTTVASLSSPVIGLGPCLVKVCGRNHSSIPTQPCTRARASAPPRAPIVAFIRTFWPHHSAPQSRRPGFQFGTKTRQVAPQCAIAQGPPGQAKICNANRLKAKRSPRNALPSRATATPGIRTIQLVHLRGYNALVVVRLLKKQPPQHRHAAPPPAIYAPSSGRWESTQTVAVTPIARRHSHTARITHSARRQGLPPLPVHPSEGWAWNLAGECLESNWNPIGT